MVRGCRLHVSGCVCGPAQVGRGGGGGLMSYLPPGRVGPSLVMLNVYSVPDGAGAFMIYFSVHIQLQMVEGQFIMRGFGHRPRQKVGLAFHR